MAFKRNCGMSGEFCLRNDCITPEPRGEGGSCAMERMGLEHAAGPGDDPRLSLKPIKQVEQEIAARREPPRDLYAEAFGPKAAAVDARAFARLFDEREAVDGHLGRVDAEIQAHAAATIAMADGGAPYAEKQSAGNPKDRIAMSAGRLDLSLFPQTAIIYGALGMTEGDAKYAGYNYRVAGVRASTYIAAGMRHRFKWYGGEWADPKTKVPHLASAISADAILIDAIECGKLIDDRPPIMGGDVAGLLTRFEEIVKHLYTIFPDGPARYTEVEHGNK